MSPTNWRSSSIPEDRKRKLHHRQRIRALVSELKKRANEDAASRAASLAMHDEGGPTRTGD
jgi:hypothetical protein